MATTSTASSSGSSMSDSSSPGGDPYKNIDKPFNCVVCKVLKNVALMLPCLHHVCAEHLGQLRFTPKPGEEKDAACSCCGNKFDSSIVPMVQAKEMLQKIKLSKIVNCTFCKRKSPAIKFCLPCEEFLCPACTDSHIYMKSTCKHSLLAVEEGYTIMKEKGKIEEKKVVVKCEEHKSELSLFCVTCDVQICSDCKPVSHEGHDVQEMAALITELREMLREGLTDFKPYVDVTRSGLVELSDKAAGILTIQKNKLLQRAQSHLNKAMVLILKREAEIREDIVAKTLMKRRELNFKIATLKSAKLQTEQFLQLIPQYLELSDNDLFAKRKVFTEQFRNLQRHSTTFMDINNLKLYTERGWFFHMLAPDEEEDNALEACLDRLGTIFYTNGEEFQPQLGTLRPEWYEPPSRGKLQEVLLGNFVGKMPEKMEDPTKDHASDVLGASLPSSPSLDPLVSTSEILVNLEKPSVNRENIGLDKEVGVEIDGLDKNSKKQTKPFSALSDKKIEVGLETSVLHDEEDMEVAVIDQVKEQSAEKMGMYNEEAMELELSVTDSDKPEVLPSKISNGSAPETRVPAKHTEQTSFGIYKDMSIEKQKRQELEVGKDKKLQKRNTEITTLPNLPVSQAQLSKTAVKGTDDKQLAVTHKAPPADMAKETSSTSSADLLSSLQEGTRVHLKLEPNESVPVAPPEKRRSRGRPPKRLENYSLSSKEKAPHKDPPASPSRRRTLRKRGLKDESKPEEEMRRSSSRTRKSSGPCEPETALKTPKSEPSSSGVLKKQRKKPGPCEPETALKTPKSEPSSSGVLKKERKKPGPVPGMKRGRKKSEAQPGFLKELLTLPMVLSKSNITLGDPNEDYCTVCLDGGDSMICCDFCPKVFHLECHLPVVTAIPDENVEWQCMCCTKKEDLDKMPEPDDLSKLMRLPENKGITNKEFIHACKFLAELYKCTGSIFVGSKFAYNFKRKNFFDPENLNSIRLRLTQHDPTDFSSIDEVLLAARKMVYQANGFYTGLTEPGIWDTWIEFKEGYSKVLQLYYPGASAEYVPDPSDPEIKPYEPEKWKTEK